MRAKLFIGLPLFVALWRGVQAQQILAWDESCRQADPYDAAAYRTLYGILHLEFND